MDVVIEKTDRKVDALKIAQTLPDYFDKHGLELIEKDLNTHILYGAFDVNKMVGFITFNKLNPQALELSWMAVLSKYQGEGIGTKLFSESIQDLSGDYEVCEVKTLAETQPDPGYDKTRKFYKKLGFVPIEIIDPYPEWSPGNPCQIMVKFIKV